MRKNLGSLSLSLLMLGALSLAPMSAEGKTINWPAEGNTPGDVETTLRDTTYNRTPDSLFITSSLNNNTININSGSVGGAVYVALSADTTDAVGNTLNIYGGIIGTNTMNGSNTTGDAVAGYSRMGAALYNTVNMSVRGYSKTRFSRRY